MAVAASLCAACSSSKATKDAVFIRVVGPTSYSLPVTIVIGAQPPQTETVRLPWTSKTLDLPAGTTVALSAPLGVFGVTTFTCQLVSNGEPIAVDSKGNGTLSCSGHV